MSKFFINRPIVAMVIAILTVIGGLVSLFGLPLAQFPSIVPTQIYVSTTYTGADAISVEQAVATPLEQAMNGVENMLYMQSTNANDGTLQEIITFSIDSDPNIDQVNVENRLSQAEPNFPPDVNQYGLQLRKSTGFPMMLIPLFSPHNTRRSLFLANYANINIVDTLYRVKGVGEVRIFGAGNYTMRLWVKPQLLAKLGLTVSDIVSAVQQQNTVNPVGQVGNQPAPEGVEKTYTVRAQGTLVTPEEFGQIVVRSNPDGSLVRLKDIARIELGALSYEQIARFKGQPSCVIAIFQTPGSNAIEVSNGVKKAMDQLKTRFPPDLDYTVGLDTTLPVTEGIKEILKTLMISMVLVTLVVFLFLQNWRATLIPMIAVPVSLIGTFILFPFLHFSVNTLSLFGLVLAIGLVVDDAIVVVECIERHIEEGLAPKDAAFKAMEEVSGPVIGIALVLSSVFIPVALMAGIQGSLNKQFALTVAISVLISAFNALSLSPALASLLLRPRKKQTGPAGRFFENFNAWFKKVTDRYGSLSLSVIRKAFIAMIVLVGFALLDGGMGVKIPTGFLPNEDYGFCFLNLQLPAASSLQRTDAVCRQVEGILGQTPGVKSYVTVAGFSLLSRVSATYNGFFFITFKPWGERTSKALQVQAIVNQLNKKLAAQVPGAKAFAGLPPAIPGLGTSGGFTFWVQDKSGGSIEYLDENLKKFLAACKKRPELTGVISQFAANVPQIYADVDRDKVLKQGVAIGDVYQTLQAFLGAVYINQFNRFGRQWDVFMQANGEDRTSIDSIKQFYVRNRQGQMVPLSSFVKIRKVFGVEYTNRFNLFRAAQVLGSAAPGYSSGQALNALEEVAKETLPHQMGFDYSDLSFQEKTVGGTAGPIFALSIIVVFLILAALYESWSLPFSVLLSVPIAIFGAFSGLFMRHFDLNIYSQIGLIMLIGLSAKNAILIVEFAKLEHEKGRDIVEAALEGAKLRLRPILMTSFAFILGCTPLWFASGSGSVARQILGTVVISGMLAATLIAIFIIPALFVVIETLAIKKKKK